MMDITIILATVLLVLVVIIFFMQKDDVFTKQGIPGPMKLPLFGTAYLMFLRGLHGLDEENRKRYGKVARVSSFGSDGLVIFDADLLKEVMIKESHVFTDHLKVANTLPKPFDRGITALEGDEWRRVRHAISPTFTSGKLKKMTQMVFDSVEILNDKMMTFARKNEDIDLKKEFRRYTMAVISETMFGLKTDALTNDDNLFLKNAEKVMSFGTLAFFKFMLKTVPGFKTLLKGHDIFDMEALNFLVNVAKQSMKERKGNEDQYHDFLSLMLKAEITEEELGQSETKKKVRGLTTEEIIAQSVFFMIAGFDTTAVALTYSVYLLALHPEIQERLREEVESKFCTDSPESLYESINQMTYLDQCFKECLRLYPPAPRSDRVATQDTMIGNIKVPKKSLVIIPIRTVLRDPEYWEDPETFNPDRFADNAGDITKVPFTFMVFGNGPRNCIGMRFAILEAKLALAALLKNMRFVPCEKTPEEPVKCSMMGITRPLKPIIVRAEPIN